MLGIIIIFGLSLGRTVCGWLCPLGLIQELLHKIPTPKIKKSRVTRALSYLKYVILAVFVVAVPMWYGVRHDLAVPGFCKYICPAGTFEGAIGLLSNPKNTSYFAMLKILFTRKFVIMIIIGTACIFCYRSFCRFICPLGAIYGLFNKLALISVKVDENRCNGCGACVRSCKMDVRHVGDHECINCAKCMGACNQNALSLKCGTHTLIAPACGCADDREDSAAKRAKNGKIGWGVALAVLCFALLWFNVLDPDLPKSQAADATVQTADAGAQAGDSAQAGDDAQVGDDAQASEGAQAAGETQAADGTRTEDAQPADAAQTADGTQTGEAAAPGNTYASSAPIGTAIGNQLADFTAEKLDGTQFRLADTRGKVVILNMWATYCGPCVQELPEFESFQKAHADDVVVFIIHASDPLEDVPEFLAKKGIGLPCAIDSDDDRIYTLCGANPSILPHTVVLNRNGEITYNQTGSMTGALLDELFEKAK